jgi:hypothetical protein
MEYATHFSGADKHKVDPFLAKELSDSGLIKKIEFGVRSKDEVGKAIGPQATNDRRPY